MFFAPGAIRSNGFGAILIIFLSRLPPLLYTPPLFSSWYLPVFGEQCCSVGAAPWPLMWCCRYLGVMATLTEREFSLGKVVFTCFVWKCCPRSHQVRSSSDEDNLLKDVGCLLSGNLISGLAQNVIRTRTKYLQSTAVAVLLYKQFTTQRKDELGRQLKYSQGNLFQAI